MGGEYRWVAIEWDESKGGGETEWDESIGVGWVD